ncbi:MAG: glycosyltransferase family 2 protein [Promethearchaeota archaeon]
MKLSIIIPCYNEDYTIKPLLKRIFEVNFPIDREIIVIDDGSDNNHREILKEEINTKKIKFIRIPLNQGKGVAIRIGLKYSTGDIIVIQDADFEYFPSDIPNLLRPILNKQAEVVYGTRRNSFNQFMAKSHLIGNLILTKMTNFLYKAKITDMETGYKMVTRRVLNKISLNAREFEFEPEITSKIILEGFKIIEIPIKYHYRDFGTAKINLLDGFEGILVLIQNRYFKNSKIYQFLYNIYKFHFKKIGYNLLNSILFFIKKRL